MRKRILIIGLLLVNLPIAFSQGPEITSWIRNTTGATGYGGIESNVQVVQYTTTDVYVSSTCIPYYTIGPWTANPNTPSDQSIVTKLTRNPVQNTGTLTSTPMGNIGVWTNGVVIFNQKDGYYWNNTTSSFSSPGTGTWNRNALVYEGISFDNCLGHPNQQGTYHHHVNPSCLYDATNSSVHSPIIGYAFDGFPIYGAYGFTNVDGTGAIKRMESSYVLSTAISRLNGPPVNSTYPLGNMCEDYVFTQGAGDLDVHNGRFCITPEYPNGIYAYFVTIDANLYPVYPFVIGATYYGTVQAGNTGPQGGNNTIPGSTTVYTGSTSAQLEENWNSTIISTVSPNPTSDFIYIELDPNSINNVKATLLNSKGQIVQTIDFLQPSMKCGIDLSNESKGLYILKLESNGQITNHRVIKK